MALVIGNSAYENVPRLTNPSNDASDVAAKLKALGFEVVEGIDLGKRDMEKRIRTFAAALSGADVGLFYYAGHGLQVDQRNFLAPIDAQLKSESDLDFEAVQLDLVLKNMVRNASTSIVFLDACRDNPLAANLAQVGRSLDVGRGLARVEAAASMMIVYATEPGKVALDGTGRNSPFTGALLRHIDTEGASISDVMIAVRNDVLSETSGKQRPFESASLTGQFFFKPKPQATADKASSGSDEISVLREQIAKLQEDQGALLKSQQEQLAALQNRLEAETKTAEPAAPQSARLRHDQPRGRSRAGKERRTCSNGDFRISSRFARTDCDTPRGRHQGRRRRGQGHRRAQAGNRKDIRGAVARERHARAARAGHARRAIEARLLFREHQRQLEHPRGSRSTASTATQSSTFRSISRNRRASMP